MIFSFRSQVHRFPQFKPWTVFSKPHSRSIWLFSKPKASSVPSIYKPRRDPWISPTIILVGCIPVLTFALGTWQLGRLKWKINLIDELQEKLELNPLILPSKVNISVLPDFLWRKVYLKGKWDHEHAMLIGPRVREGVHGMHVVTPLVRENGSTVLVNRGFISNEFAQDMSFSKSEEEVELVGMLRTSQPRNTFTPDNTPEEGKWYWTDVDGMAEFAGGEKANVQPVFVEQIFLGHAGDAALCVSQGTPVGRPATVDLRNAHLSYVITWYGLSALTSMLFIRLIIKRKNTRTRKLPRYT